MNIGSICDAILNFLRKFFSLIIALLMAVFTLLFVIAAAIIISKNKSFGKAGFAHFLAIIFSICTVICYLILHFVPRKAYRLLYALTFLLLTTTFLVSHSFGLVAIDVNDCRISGSLSVNASWSGFGDVGSILGDNDANVTIGSLGQPVSNCGTNALLFAAAFLNLILYIVALFDVQTVLLARVKSKTYGERFVEMGISN